MSYYQQQNRNRLSIGQDGNALTYLIAINLMAFVILAFIKIIYYFSYNSSTDGTLAFNTNILDWVALPASFSKLISRPWTLLTHMIAHDTGAVWQMVANLLWLWAFGYIFQDLAGNRKIIPLYIYGALAGAVAFMLFYNLIPSFHSYLEFEKHMGASAGIMAIAIASTTMAPKFRIFTMLNGGIPLWVVTVIFLIIDLATMSYSNPGEHIAHLAGGATGFFFVKSWQRGRDWTAWMGNLYDWINNLFNPDRPKKGVVIKTQLFYKSKIQPFRRTPVVTQQKIDEILDKISQKGYGSLTDDEKEVLKRASKEDL